MAKLGVTKKKKSPRGNELSQLKEELRRVSEQLEFRDRALAEAFEQQTATSEILGGSLARRLIFSRCLMLSAENAARLCEANDAVIYRVEEDVLQGVALYGPIPMREAPLSQSRLYDRPRCG